jgi:hypothetical protein
VRGDESGPSLQIFHKFKNKIFIKPEKGTLPKKIYTIPIYPSPKNVAKILWTLTLDIQTVCINGGS